VAGPGVELATAWVRLVPSAEGVQENTAKALIPAEKAAEDAGDKSGKRFSAGMKTAMVAGGALIVGGVVAAFKGLYEVGAVFDDITDTIRVGTGAQGDALEGLVDVAKNVGATVPAEFESIGSTVADLNTRLGLSGDTLETVASQYLEAGRILGTEVDINKTSAAFSAFKIQGDEVSGAMDTLFQVSQATGVGMNELASGAQAMAPALQTLGFSFEDSIALVGSFDKAGLNSTAIMAAMSKGMVTLAKDGEEPASAYKRVVGELQGFIDKGDEAGALKLAGKVFGTRGAAQFIGALQSGVLNMDDLMAATGATGDTILGVGEETMDFAERWQVTMNNAMLAIEPLASAVFTAIGDGLAGAMPFLQDLGKWVGENTGVIAAFAGILGTTVVAAFFAWAASIWASTVALLANPITWIILAIVALIAAVVLLVANWDAVVKFLTDVWGNFISWITGVIDGFVAWWNATWSAVGKFISDLWNRWIVAPIRTAINWIARTVSDTIRNIRTGWENGWRAIGNFVRDIWNNIIGWIEGGVNGAIDLINGFTGGIRAVGSAVFGVDIGPIPHVKLPRLAMGATILPRPGGTAAILAEAGRAETVVDHGLMNRALEEGLAGNSSPSVLVVVDADGQLIGRMRIEADRQIAVADDANDRELARGRW